MGREIRAYRNQAMTYDLLKSQSGGTLNIGMMEGMSVASRATSGRDGAFAFYLAQQSLNLSDGNASRVDPAEIAKNPERLLWAKALVSEHSTVTRNEAQAVLEYMQQEANVKKTDIKSVIGRMLNSYRGSGDPNDDKNKSRVDIEFEKYFSGGALFGPTEKGIDDV